MSEQRIIRVTKKKGSEAAHGGSWKVAYADFVTAMMAFFLVMWIISMNQQMKEEVQNYFNNPMSAAHSKAGISSLAAGGISPISNGLSRSLNVKNWHELALEAEKDRFYQVQASLQEALTKRPDLARLKDQVEVTVGATGLLIELIDSHDGMFFDSGSARLPADAVRLLQIVAHHLGRLPNPIAIEGHTDVVRYRPGTAYTNWELSADRANAARRVLEVSGLQPHQVVEVRGDADSHLRRPDEPTHYSNRRVSIIVSYKHLKPPAAEEERARSSHDRSVPFDLDLRPLTQKAGSSQTTPL